MNFSGIYQFGALTTRNGEVLRFEDIDTDCNGKISQQEFIFIQKELGMDTVEFSEQDEQGEKDVTDYEFVLWNQEAKMQKAFENLSGLVSRDFIGDNAKYSKPIMKEMRTFLKDFKEEYMNSENSIGGMAEAFQTALAQKYIAIKQEYLN